MAADYPAPVRQLAVVSLAGVALVAALAGCGADKEKTAPTRATTPAPTRPTTTARRPAPAAALPPGPRTCQRVARPTARGPQHVPKPKARLNPARTYTAVVLTSCGNFAIALDVKRAPKTAASFAYLARRGFYNGLTFHRIVPGFVIQGGDPQGNGQGGPGYSVVEAPPHSLKYTRGVVAMAKSEIQDPGTSGSQFFIVTGPDAQLPADYALVGKVSAGLDVVDRIATQPTDQSNPDPARREQPVRPVVIRRLTIRQSR
jgi:peptidyl-prolyl cis-trans isomerase B (cyclophilin B)